MKINIEYKMLEKEDKGIRIRELYYFSSCFNKMPDRSSLGEEGRIYFAFQAVNSPTMLLPIVAVQV